jgi:type IV pilus assembly protein PilV
MVKKTMSAHKGFTLIEVLVAVFLLVVALFGAASVTTSVIKANTFSQTLTTATILAKDKMEELKASTYTTATQAASTWTGTDYASTDGTVQASSSGSCYTRSWTAPGTTTKTITVTVTWATDRTVELKTIRARD